LTTVLDITKVISDVAILTLQELLDRPISGMCGSYGVNPVIIMSRGQMVTKPRRHTLENQLKTH